MRIFRLFFGVMALGLLTGPVFQIPVEAAATFPGQNGGIAFTKTRGKTSDIWYLKANGQYERLLTKGAYQPVWSPDGRKLMFIDKHPQGDRLQLINANGSKRKSLTHANGAVESSPAWSVDGSRVAFVRTKQTAAGTKSAIFIVKLKGYQETNVTGWLHGGDYRTPSWSPDGIRIVYEKNHGVQGELIIQNLANGHKRQLTVLSDSVESHVSWSTNGKKILYNDSHGQVYTIWPDGSHRTVISDGDSYSASWSPDGNKIAFLEHPTDDHLSISEPDGTVIWVPIQKANNQTLGAPIWSPDGTKLVFTMGSTGSNANSSLHLLDIASQTTTKLTSNTLNQVNWQAR